METLQQRIKASLIATGIPHKEVKCFGSQILITCWSEKSAERFKAVLHSMNCSIVRGVVHSREDNVKNEGTCLLKSWHHVWRVGAAV